LAERGVRNAVLSTQEDNTVSRMLYRTLGFTESQDRLLVCASGALQDLPAGRGAVSTCADA
jgi:hypothetical protein